MPSATAYDAAALEARRGAQPSASPDYRQMVRLATLAASSHNTQPWKFRLAENRIDILPDFTRRCPVVDPQDSHLFQSLGCAAENLVHAAAAQGYHAEVRFDPAHDVVQVHLHRTASARESVLVHAIPARQCSRTAYDGTPLSNAEMARLEEAARGPGVRAMVLCSGTQMAALADYVRNGNIEQLSNTAFRRELMSWIRFNPTDALATGDGLCGRTTGQPSVPTWLGRLASRFVITPEGQAETDQKHLRSSSGVMVFVSKGDDKDAWIETGRCYERFALRATALGVRNAFVNQPVEVGWLRSQLESWLGLSNERAQLVVRFGHGPEAPFSLRRPLEEVILPSSRYNEEERKSTIHAF